MNREIKFRGLALDPCSPPFWIYGYFSEVESEGKKYSYIIWQGNTNQIYPNSECQFTGLKDKNGKEIYEGDIVKFIDEDFIDGPVECITDVFWWNEFARFSLHNNNKDLIWLDAEDMEVIGKIFENPELLEETR